MPSPTLARQIALGLVRTGRALGAARQLDPEVLTLACASQHAAYCWIEINGRAVWRGDSFQDAEVLQRGFARRMAALGRGGARGA